MTILHGENTFASRQRLQELVDFARSNKTVITRLTAKQLSPADLELALGSNSLFAEEKVIVIEELHSLPRSKRKNELIEQIAATETEVILWEKRSLTKTMLKKFPKAQAQEFKVGKKLFAWLDSFGRDKKKTFKLLSESIEQEGEHFCFLMLIRQIRLLIQIKEGAVIRLAPFMKSKLSSQAKTFSLEQLLKLHTQLFEIDKNMKTGQAKLPLGQELALLTLSS